MTISLKIYQAPLQGFTDWVFRRTFHEVWGGVDRFFIPYICYGKGHEIKRSQLRDVAPEHNRGMPVVPQVLFSNAAELISLAKLLIEYGYPEINLNLGCPYPMVTNKGRGSAWLPDPEKLQGALQELFSTNLNVRFSVKLRAGLKSTGEAAPIVECLNQFPFTELIFHPRTANQMYDGEADKTVFAEMVPKTTIPLIYNGDINSFEDFQKLQQLSPEVNAVMIGRGLLMDPALPLKLNGVEPDENTRREKLEEFHDTLFEAYANTLQGDGHLLQKMEQFWFYFSHSFENSHKARKLIKKATSRAKYQQAIAEIFRTL